MFSFRKKSDIEIQEEVVDIVEQIQQVPKAWWYVLGVLAVLSIPTVMLSSRLFARSFISGYEPPAITYKKPNAQPIKIVEKGKVSSNGGYIGYARILNPNTDLAVRQLDYKMSMLDSAGVELAEYSNTTYILPGEEKMVFMPEQEVPLPASIEIAVTPQHWVQGASIVDLQFVFERIEYPQSQSAPFFVAANLRNDTPYQINEISLGVVLYDIQRNIVGVNFTTINLVQPRESRFFRVVWPAGVSGQVVDVEFLPSVNQLVSGIISTHTSTFDEFDPRGQ